jgi:hypothetical protein
MRKGSIENKQEEFEISELEKIGKSKERVLNMRRIS